MQHRYNEPMLSSRPWKDLCNMFRRWRFKEYICLCVQEASAKPLGPKAWCCESDAWEADSVLRQSSTAGGQEQDDEGGERSPRIKALGRLKSRAQERQLASISNNLNRCATGLRLCLQLCILLILELITLRLAPPQACFSHAE